MSIPPGWERVSKANPGPVCRRHDWCLIALDRSAAICPRTEEGAIKRVGDAGHLHPLEPSHELKQDMSWSMTLAYTDGHAQDFANG